MKLSIRLPSLALFGLINCSGLKHSSNASYTEIITDAQLAESMENGSAPSAPMEIIEDPTTAYIPPPKQAFLGLAKWNVIQELLPEKPFFFITNLEMNSSTLMSKAREFVNFGLHLDAEDIKLMNSIKDQRILFELIQSIKENFRRALAPDTPTLIYCVSPVGASSEVLTALSLSHIIRLKIGAPCNDYNGPCQGADLMLVITSDEDSMSRFIRANSKKSRIQFHQKS